MSQVQFWYPTAGGDNWKLSPNLITQGMAHVYSHAHTHTRTCVHIYNDDKFQKESRLYILYTRKT